MAKTQVHKENIASVECRLLVAARLVVIPGGQCQLESPEWKKAARLERSMRKMR